jgi:hypothetical protein
MLSDLDRKDRGSMSVEVCMEKIGWRVIFEIVVNEV